MKKIVLLGFVFIIGFQSFSQKLNKKIIDTKTQKIILYGNCNIKGLTCDEYGEIYKMEFKYYSPDSFLVFQLKPYINKLKFEIVMGTWCEDSQQQVPRFFKLLDLLNYKKRKVRILCIDHYFKAENFEKGTNNINKIPTFIIYFKNKEIGRIIETPTINFEKDLLNIIQANKL